MVDVLVKFFRSGGPWMYPILMVQIVGFAVVIERILVLLFKNRIDTVSFVNRIFEMVQRQSISNAIEFCSRSSAALPKIIKAGLLEYNKSQKDIQNAMELATMAEIPKLEKRTHYLQAIANVATLLGLLGTIQGLIASFEAVAKADASVKAALLSAGISEAMNCTAFGLIVAIPCLLLYSFLQEKTTELSDEISLNSTWIFKRIVSGKKES
jgi:biopolymer transport protein ExbB